MTSYTVKTVGSDEIIHTFDQISSNVWTKSAFARAGARFQRDLATYPQQRPTTYRRTGTLGRRWTFEVNVSTPFRIQLIVGNNTSYAPYVQSESKQASVHRNVWQTDDDVTERNIPLLMKELSDELDTVIS